MSTYEIAVLGSVSAEERDRLIATLSSLVEDFGIVVGDDLAIRDGDTLALRDPRAASAAAYYGGDKESDAAALEYCRRTRVPVVPVVSEDGEFLAEIPEALHGSNGTRLRAADPDREGLAVALLECVGLLRKQRRVFISYRRTESRLAALQFHDLLSARGFDVFLDTHDVRPGDPFQDVLWHRLCDSDVLLMLDTPTYFESRWTSQEIGRARAKEIHVLRIVWPGHDPVQMTDLAETVRLDHHDLSKAEGPLVEERAEEILERIERLRSRSIAARYMSITGKLRADVARIGGEVAGIGAHRAIGLRLLDGTVLWAYPVVGLPSAELLNEIAVRTREAGLDGMPILVYDHVGLRNVWLDHMNWLDENISSVRAVKVAEAAWSLAGWE